MEEVRRQYAEKVEKVLLASNRTPVRPVEFRSQCGEDGFIWDLFERGPAPLLEGFYIEVGAFNGYDFSTTYALDCAGWRGLLVEPIPERYAECVRNRPTARVVHAALGGPGSSGTTTFTVTDDIHGGMLSRLGVDRRARPGDVKSERQVTVPFTTMDALLAGHTGEIDVAVIDVEGAEVPLLKGFSLEKYGPKVILIEDEKGETPIEQHMRTRPYQQIGWMAFNRVYARNDLAYEFAVRLYGPEAFR